MDEPVKFEDVQIVGKSKYGYIFVAGRVGDRWVGGAFSHVPGAAGPLYSSAGPCREYGGRLYSDGSGARGLLFVFPRIAIGTELGVPSRELAIRLVAALAQDPAAAYGAIDEWGVPAGLRATPADFRCARCHEIHPAESACDPWDMMDENQFFPV